MSRPNYTVFDNKTQLSEEAARQFLLKAGSAKAQNQPFRVALAGGGATPALLYQLLTQPNHRDEMDWHNLQLFFGDERCVAPASPDSNFHMVTDSLLSQLDADHSPQVFRMEGEREPLEAAQRYEQTLRQEFGIGDQEIPRFDLILLGMGADGHTASLFPHKESLTVTDRLVAAAEPGLKPFVSRLTLTYPVLNNAATVLFLVAGEDKAETVKAVFDGDFQPDALPSQAVQPTQGTLTWLLDKAAASLLG